MHGHVTVTASHGLALIDPCTLLAVKYVLETELVSFLCCMTA